jgi:hypothetical protein
MTKQVWLCLAFVLGTSMQPSGAIAQIASDATSCAGARAIMEAPQPTKEDLIAIGDFVKSVLYLMDNINTTKGDPAIIGPMSEEARNDVVDLVMERCAKQPVEMLRDTTVQVYADLKASRKATGTDPAK